MFLKNCLSVSFFIKRKSCVVGKLIEFVKAAVENFEVFPKFCCNDFSGDVHKRCNNVFISTLEFLVNAFIPDLFQNNFVAKE